MRKKEIEAKLDKLAKDGQSLWEYAFSTPPSQPSAEVADLRKEIKKLRDLLDEVIEPGYVLAKRGGQGKSLLSAYDYLGASFWGFDRKPAPKPTKGYYEIRTRISNKLIATFTTREDADAFIETLCEVVVDETGEEQSE